MIEIKKIKNSYGLTELNMCGNNKFHKNTYIYAPNGTFKTSFSNFFASIFNDKSKIKDRYNDSKKSEYELCIYNQTITETSNDNLRDISFYDFSLEKYGSLFLDSNFYRNLAYDTKIIKLIEEKYSRIKEELKKISSLLIYLGIDIFNFDYSSLTTVLKLKSITSDLSEKEIDYIFELFKEDKKYKFSKEPKAITNLRGELEIQELKKDYESISQSSDKKFIKGIFTLEKADAFVKTISKSEDFFNVGHRIKLEDDSKYYDNKSLNELFQKELNEILENGSSRDAYEKIKSSLFSAANTKIFAEKFLKDSKFIMFLSINSDLTKRVIEWLFDNNLDINYIDHVDFLMIEDILGEIIEVVDSNQNSKTKLEQIFDEFNIKFIDYMKVKLINKTDAILNRQLPMIELRLNNNIIDREKINYISSGEKRALAFIHFYMDIKLSNNDEKIIIIDDGAEAFDYAYKYSFIEYLLELSEEPNTQLVVLSHNFDFVRTLSSRSKSNETRIARKKGLVINLRKEKLKRLPEPLEGSPFSNLAQIPIIRELSTIIKNDDVEQKLTDLLHIKNQQIHDIILNDVYVIGKKMGVEIFDFKDNNDKYFNYIVETVKNDTTDDLDNDLSKKIVYSMAIRLMFEEYFIDKILNGNYNELECIEENQTRYMLNKLEEEEQRIFSPILIKTPDFIHINSLSYEPLYDISLGQLKNLRDDIIKHIETSKIVQ